MEFIQNKKIKMIAILVFFIFILTISLSSLAVNNIYTSYLTQNDKLKFTGNAWCVFKTQAIAESVGNGKHPKVKRYNSLH